MQLLDKISGYFPPPQLTPQRMGAAIVTAVVADVLQIPGTVVPLAPIVVDLVAMVLTTRALGFHVLLLPTFVLELIPVAGMLPTWTGCVIAVLALRRRQRAPQAPGASPGPQAAAPLLPPLVTTGSPRTSGQITPSSSDDPWS